MPLQNLQDVAAHAAIPDAHHPPVALKTGSYTGNDAVNRAVPHGLGVTPKVVLIIGQEVRARNFTIIDQDARIYLQDPEGFLGHTVTAMDATNFYVGCVTSLGESANADTIPYLWVAIGQ